MNKEFLNYQTIRNNSIKLAHKIHEDGFIPDVIYVSLRGGAYMGNVISEYFKVVRRNQRPVFYAAVVARSYSDVREQENIRIDGWTYNPKYLRNGDRILLVDDIFDSGRTINHLVKICMDKGIPRDDIRIAVHDYKIRSFLKEQPSISPDYFCRKHIIDSTEDDTWVHYLSHELVGLTDLEIRENYGDDPDVVKLLIQLRKDRG